MEELWNQQYSLSEVIEEKNFKNYAELEARFNTVVANTAGSEPDEAGVTDRKEVSDEQTDNTLDYFKKLAEQE